MSQSDRDRHYISPNRLAELYKVNPEECYFAKDDNDPLLLALRRGEGLIELYPRYDGKYSCKSANQKGQ